MLLDRIDDEKLKELGKGKSGQEEFQPDRYEIYTRYNTASGTMTYVAGRKDLKDETIPLGYWFSVGVDLHVSHGQKFLWYPLLVYLRDMEKNMSEEKQKEMYGEAYYTLGAVAGLSKKELEDREKARSAFLTFLDRLDNKGLLNEQNLQEMVLQLCFEVEGLSEKNKSLTLSMKVGPAGGRQYIVKDARKFSETLKKGGEMVFSTKFSVHLSPDAFEESWRSFMFHFPEYFDFRNIGDARYFLVPREKIPAFISQIPESARKSILFSEEKAWNIVEEDIPASVSLDSDGSIHLQPEINDAKEIRIISERQMVLINRSKRKITLFHFDSPVNAELYNYFAGKTRKEVEYVQDLFVKKIVPVSSGIIRKSTKNVFEIALYVSLERNSTLAFRTEYRVGDEKHEKAFFEGKPIESAMIRSYEITLANLNGVPNGKVSDAGSVLSFLKSDLGPLRQVASVYLDERIRRLNMRGAPEVKITATRVDGWLNLSIYSKDYSEDELAEIYAAYRKKKSFFLLRDDLIVLEPEKMQAVEEIIEEVGAEKKLSDIVLPFYHAMQLESFRDSGVEISMDRFVKKAITDVVEYKKEKLALPQDLGKVLRPYQEDGIRWMRRLSKYGFSGILADDMGLGKTLQVLTFLSASDFNKPVLVVCPKSLVYNWRNEVRKWMGDIPVVIISGTRENRLALIQSIPKEGKTLYITGYDSLRMDIEAYQEKGFYLVLADEAQNVKNASTQKAKAIRKIESDMRMALTGTPVENSLTDLWSIFDFLMPGYLGTESGFRTKYEIEPDQAKARAELARKVSPFLLRRSKEEVLDFLPGKEVILVTVSMADQQRGLYEAYLQKARNIAKKEKGVSVLAALTHLRQICVDPSVFLEDYEETSGKMAVALEQVMVAIQGGHRVLVFSSFTRVLEHFRYYLEEKDIRSYYINGDTPGAMRVEMAERFNREDRIKVMLISIKAGGTGLNLIGADTVIHMDPWWNFAVEEQATDRAYRIGQTKPVTVYKLISHDSIEEKVVELQEKKRKASADVVHTSIEGIDSLSADDINFILE
ncbi:MAG: SNF2 helicase associated domain-containing protein [Clostridia bacterium]|nr:SNF2 helicase associated domain-containing protein [Clostridia bacterium]